MYVHFAKSTVYPQIIVFPKHQAKINSHLIKTFYYVVHTRPFKESATELSGKTEHRQQTHQLKTIAIYSQNNSSNFFFISISLFSASQEDKNKKKYRLVVE